MKFRLPVLMSRFAQCILLCFLLSFMALNASAQKKTTNKKATTTQKAVPQKKSTSTSQKKSTTTQKATPQKQTTTKKKSTTTTTKKTSSSKNTTSKPKTEKEKIIEGSKKVQALQKEKSELQRTLNKSKDELNQTKKQVQTGQKDLHYIGQQLDNRLTRIRQMEGELEQLDSQIVSTQTKVNSIEKQLAEKRAKLKAAVRYARSCKEYTSPMLFVLSAKKITQMFRRARYARQYVRYETNLGVQILQKQSELLAAQNKLLSSKSQMNNVLREVMSQRKELNMQQVSTQKKVDTLKKKEVGLEGQVREQQKQLQLLDKKIDDLIAYEIEQARKRAEEAARKAAEEAARKAAAAAKDKKSTKGTSTKSGKSTSTSEHQEKTDQSTSVKSGKSSGKTTSGSWLTPQDKQLNGSFEHNKGRLPVPITGSYMVGNRFGIYNVPGLKNVQLDNKGTNYVGKPGARARCIFDGEVSAVFQFGGTKNVLVRHGSYISVYCNLSSVIVTKGQKVRAKDLLGTIASDSNGNYILHFQLRKETAKLNPEAWISR